MAGRFGGLFAALLLAVSGAAQAANINARSPSFADVSTAVASAKNGDTVIVPAGTASWTKTLVINKPITLIGQTTVSYTNETANDRTIILDDVSRSSNAACSYYTCHVKRGGHVRGAYGAAASNKRIHFQGQSQYAKGCSERRHHVGWHLSSSPDQQLSFRQPLPVINLYLRMDLWRDG